MRLTLNNQLIAPSSVSAGVRAVRFAGVSPGSVRMVGRCLNYGVGEREYVSRLFIVWSEAESCFEQREEQLSYNVDKKKYVALNVSDLDRPLRHGWVLSSDFVAGTVVDNVNKRLILPDGRWIDGPTGNVYSIHDQLMVSGNPETQPKSTFEKVV